MGFGPTDVEGGWPGGGYGYIVAKPPKTLDPKRCKVLYYDAYSGSQCDNKVWKDGYCKYHYHHPRRDDLFT